MKKQNLFGSLLVACLMASCSSGSSDEIIPSAPEKPAEKLPITLKTQLSRITDNSFALLIQAHGIRIRLSIGRIILLMPISTFIIRT